ncbi:NAD(P)-binding protein [Myriangium duriaei CBS 260.36]|uniref:NAD(P)-binding protein n=1 Tax=Myriangium duriaei CBS 260.36 TaxID=1168546 RepID=A0A9P4J0H2_9PEZI|nr:NAD(P)-binding protein [Myriangium duriaei CBS 260.36]
MTFHDAKTPIRQPRTALIIGASGYIGHAVARGFVRSGWRTFGLVRRPEATTELIAHEIIPVLGSLSDPDRFSDLIPDAIELIVSCTEQVPGYAAHFEQVLATVRFIAARSQARGVRPLVLWTSGCKDYGTTDVNNATDLAPHTEDSPLNAPQLLQERAQMCPRVFEQKDVFDAILLRPTSVFGFTSSYYAGLFDYAAAESARGAQTLAVSADPEAIMHALHVDDCAEAYVTLATFADRSAIVGQAFNISSARYETAAEVCGALAHEYGFAGGVEFVHEKSSGALHFPKWLKFVVNYSQWVDSAKIRHATGWRDVRIAFSKDIQVYRRSYEANRGLAHSNAEAVQKRLEGKLTIQPEVK